MSIDKSLKLKGKLVRPRNVFTRKERIQILRQEGRWNPAESVYGIPKVKVVKLKQKSKSEQKAKEKAEEALAAGKAKK
ncbi:MAG: small basic protein [wastewater metagenome]|nr:small basic protein [Candidatus Loosdrechtia aerotolerans]